MFLSEMNQVIPWDRLMAQIEPVSPKGKGGHPPYALQTILRVYFMHQWFSLSDPVMEESTTKSRMPWRRPRRTSHSRSRWQAAWNTASLSPQTRKSVTTGLMM